MSEAEVLAPAFESRYVVVPSVRTMGATLYGVRTHYVEAGGGDPPVILLHGGHGGAAGETVWQLTIPALAERHRAIGLDLLGYGHTDAPDIAYTFQAQVELVAGVVDALGLERVAVVGQSRGAYVAAKYACDHPTRVSHLVMMNTGTVADALGIDLGPPSAAFQLRGADTSGDRARLRLLMEAMTYRTKLLTDEYLEAQLRLAARPGVAEARRLDDVYYFQTLRNDPDQRQLYSLEGRLDRLSTPMLIVWGADDEFMPVRLGRELKRLLPRAAYHELPRARHHVFHDRADVVNDLLMRFFSGSATDGRQA